MMHGMALEILYLDLICSIRISKAIMKPNDNLFNNVITGLLEEHDNNEEENV